MPSGKTLERKCHENEQYLRTECLEISDIPSSIEDSALEDFVLKLFSKVNVPIGRSNAEDCYRLKSNNNAPQKLIIKLSKQKRKNAYLVCKAKSSFKNVTENGISPNTCLFVNEILCSYYKLILSKCKKLWLNKVIELFWISRFMLDKIDRYCNSVKIITHIEDLKHLFPGHGILLENASSS